MRLQNCSGTPVDLWPHHHTALQRNRYRGLDVHANFQSLHSSLLSLGPEARIPSRHRAAPEHVPQFSITWTNTSSRAPGLPWDMNQGTREGRPADSLQKHATDVNQDADGDPSLWLLRKSWNLNYQSWKAEGKLTTETTIISSANKLIAIK